MGSKRALATGLAQGKRQNALAEGTRRSHTARIEKIIVRQDSKKRKRKSERNEPVDVGIPVYLRVFILLAVYVGDLSHPGS